MRRLCIVLAAALCACGDKQDEQAITVHGQGEVPSGKDLPVVVQVPEFRFIERSGQQMGPKELLGKVWVADFIFTNCPGPCPLMTAQMHRIQERFKSSDDLRLVSITVDPERDTLPVLREYAKKYQADAEKWFFLRGPRKEAHELAFKGFKQGSKADPLNDHSIRFALVDRLGRIRNYYDGTDEKSMERLFSDLESFLSSS